MRSSDGSRLSRTLVWVAGAAGLLHAAASVYWATGGRWMLASVGRWAVDLSATEPLAARVTLGFVAVVKLSAAVVPIGVAYGKVPCRRFWRAASWTGGLLLAVYGGVSTLASAAVLAGWVRPEGGYDRVAMQGHAYLWDPLFLLWGVALVLSLWFSRRTAPDEPSTVP